MRSCALLLSLLLTLAGRPGWAEDEIVTGPDRRHEIDLRLERLDAERAEISTKGPMVATFVGLGLVLAGSLTFHFGFDRCQRGVEDIDDPACGGDLGAMVATTAGMAVLAVGGIATIAGGALWGRSVHRRNEIDAERESLIQERDGLWAAVSRLELHSDYREETHFVTLGVRF